MPVTDLLHYALEVPDQTTGERFYADFGLAPASAGDGAVHLRPSALPDDAVLLFPGPRKRLHHLAFGASGDDFAEVVAAVRRAGVRAIDPPAGAPGEGLWFRDPDGHAVVVRNVAVPAPPPDPPRAVNTPGRAARLGERGCPPATAATPRRLGHVLLFTPDLARQLAFYREVLGLRLSDRSGGLIAFLRCGTDHYNLAFLASEAPGFHHGSFEVGSVDEIAMGAAAMTSAGWQPGWGLGRHVIGSNYFFYMRDPWGSFAEYFFDIDVIPRECAWEPRDFPAEEALLRWGPAPPADFAVNRETGHRAAA